MRISQRGIRSQKYRIEYIPSNNDGANGMTGPSSPAPYVVSARETNGTNYAYKAFDRIGTSTFWKANELPPSQSWLQLYMGSSYVLKKVKLLTKDYSGSIKDFKIQGSNNGSTWTDIGSFTATSTDSTQIFNLDDNTNAYSYLRLVVLSTHGGTLCEIYELYYGVIK